MPAAGLGEARGNVRIESEPCDTEEQATAEFASVNGLRRGTKGLGDGMIRTSIDPERPRQPVPGPRWYDRERDWAECEQRGHLVHRTVSAPGDHKPIASTYGFPRKITSVSRSVRDRYGAFFCEAREYLSGALSATPAGIYRRAPRPRIDDDGD
jgi:hypothetical protein